MFETKIYWLEFNIQWKDPQLNLWGWEADLWEWDLKLSITCVLWWWQSDICLQWTCIKIQITKYCKSWQESLAKHANSWLIISRNARRKPDYIGGNSRATRSLRINLCKTVCWPKCPKTFYWTTRATWNCLAKCTKRICRRNQIEKIYRTNAS